MSNSAHMAARDAIIAALLVNPALAGGRVVGNRRRPMAEQHASQIYVYLENSDAEFGSDKVIGTTDWRTRIRVECLSRATSSVSADDGADALAVDVMSRIMADTSLSGKAIDTTPQAIFWAEDEADTPVAACQLLFSVWHATPDASISA